MKGYIRVYNIYYFLHDAHDLTLSYYFGHTFPVKIPLK